MTDQIKLRPKPEVAGDFHTTTRTIDRWVRDPKMNFPAPIKINTRIYFDADAIERWKVDRIRGEITEAA